MTNSPQRPRFQLQISERRLLLMAGDVLAIIVSVLISLRIWARVGRIPFDGEFVAAQTGWFILLVVLWIILARVNDFYDLRAASRLNTTLNRLGRITAQLLIIYLVIYFFSLRDALPRLFILYHAIISSVLIIIWRAWRPYLMGWRRLRRRALVIGTGWGAETIITTIERETPDEYEIVGLIGEANDTVTEVAAKKVLGTGRDLPALMRDHSVAELILTYSGELPGDIFEGLMTCYEQGVAMIPMPILYEQITGRVPIEHVGRQHWAVVLPLEGQSLTLRSYLSVKRLLDITIALIGLLAFALILPLIALLMRLDSPGPIFYRQERVGRGGRPFKVIKLRSMIPDAERASGPVWASGKDPRITRIGRLLRKSRLDEVPQLWNVLSGEMSMVGPRPERDVFVDQLTQQIPFYRTRLAVKPGLTGWAQVRYRYGNSVEDSLIKLQYDLYYIRHQSLALDLLIMIRTVGKMLAFQGT